MIALAILPVLILGAFVVYQELDESRDNTYNLQSEIALRIAQETQTFIEDRPRELRLVAEVRGLVGLSRDEQEAILAELLAFDTNFDELSLVDASGRETVRVSRRFVVTPGTERDRSLDETFQFALRHRDIYYSAVRFDAETGEPLMGIGLPLSDPRTGEITSVLIGEFRLRSIWDRIAAQKLVPGEDVYILTVSSEYRENQAERVIAHREPSVVLSGKTFETHGLKRVDTNLNGEQAILAVQNFSAGENEFAVVAELTTQEAYKEIYQSLYLLLAGLVIIVLVSGAIGYFVLRRMTTPIVILANAAKRLGAGDLTVQVETRSRTELGTLARTFNTMAQQLREVFGTLEARVQARTRDLQLAAQVSEQMSTILDPDQLLPQVVELTKANFDLYHAHIYLLEESGQNLVLSAGTGEAGQLMKAQGHRIALQARSLTARAVRDMTPSIVNDVREVPDFLPNPLPGRLRLRSTTPASLVR
jgi:HAMP domain-containing protein